MIVRIIGAGASHELRGVANKIDEKYPQNYPLLSNHDTSEN